MTEDQFLKQVVAPIGILLAESLFMYGLHYPIMAMIISHLGTAIILGANLLTMWKNP